MKLVIWPDSQKAISGQVINFPYSIEKEVKKFCTLGLVVVKVESSKLDDPESNKLSGLLDVYIRLLIGCNGTMPFIMTLISHH